MRQSSYQKQDPALSFRLWRLPCTFRLECAQVDLDSGEAAGSVLLFGRVPSLRYNVREFAATPRSWLFNLRRQAHFLLE